MTIKEQLEIIRNKGNCYHTLWKAEKALRQIRDVISKSDYQKIVIALSHVEIGEGAEELNGVLKSIINNCANNNTTTN